MRRKNQSEVWFIFLQSDCDITPTHTPYQFPGKERTFSEAAVQGAYQRLQSLRRLERGEGLQYNTEPVWRRAPRRVDVRLYDVSVRLSLIHI